MHKLLLLLGSTCLLSQTVLAQATNPVVTSWLLNTNTAKGFNNQAANVTSVKYSSTSVYLVCPRIPSYTLNYVAPSSGSGTPATNSWFPQPTHGPSAQTCTAYNFRIPLTPTPNTGTAVSIPGGTIGVWINGTNIHPAKDAASYQVSSGTVVNNGDAVWFTDAVVNEGIGFDVCNGHPDLQDTYHTHVNPDCLYDRRDSTRHSPIIGYAFDGYPIYGTYGYKNTDGTGGLKSMRSSYRQRSITQRHTLSDGMVLTAAQYGPDISTTHPLGKFVEDNEYVSGLGDLDKRNGRWCVTPEYPSGTYAYFCTLNSLYEGTYPYTIAGTYYGTVPYTNDANTQNIASITESVTTYAPPSALTVSTSKVLAGGSFSDVTVTGTGNLVLVQPLTVTGAMSVASGGALDTGTLDPNVQTISGAGSFALAAGAKLTIDHASGIASSGATGAVQNTGSRSFDSGGEYVYAGTVAQSTGTGLPGTVSKLTINNAAGVTMTSGATVTGTATLGSGNLLSNGRTLTINNGATVAFGAASLFTGAGTFALNSGATLKTANPVGLSPAGATGPVQSTTRTFDSGASYTYNGTAAQTVGAALSTVANLTVDNAAGVTTSGSTITVTGIAAFGNGNLAVPSNNFICNGTAVFAATPIVSGNGTFRLGGTLKTANLAGISSSGSTGSVQTTNRNFGTTANYLYNGAAAQITGTGMPATVNNLTVANAAGVTLTNTAAIAGLLTMLNGNLASNGKTLTLNSGATGVFGAAPAFTGAGAFALSSGATLKTANPAGLSSNGSTGSVQSTTRTFDSGASYTYNGTAAQATGSGLPATVKRLTVDNAAGVILSSATTVTNALTMTNGVLSTGSNTVTLNTSTGSLSESETSYVTGTVQQTKDLSAAGTTYNFGNMGLKLTPASGSTLPGSTLAVRSTGTAAPSVNGSTGIKRYFTITPTTNSGLNVTLEMGYRDGELNGIIEGTMDFYKATSSPSGPWVGQTSGTVGRDAVANTMSLTGISDFSVWTLGGPAPLPVELTAFTAERVGTAARLSWRTASEKNSAAFEVERSTDGKTFERIGTVAAQGHSSRPSDYAYLDENPTPPAAHPLAYYRLRQVDADGSASYSPVRAVDFLAALPHRLITCYPNPGSGQVQVTGAAAGQTLTLHNALGQVLRSATATGEASVPLSVPLSLDGLPPGMYVLRAGQQAQRLVVE